MGFSVKFNWVLQVAAPELLETKRVYSFEKSGNRVFPIGTAIDLIDLERTAVAKIKILSFENGSKVTTGSFEIIKIYADSEKSILSNYWRENE